MKKPQGIFQALESVEDKPMPENDTTALLDTDPENPDPQAEEQADEIKLVEASKSDDESIKFLTDIALEQDAYAELVKDGEKVIDKMEDYYEKLQKAGDETGQISAQTYGVLKVATESLMKQVGLDFSTMQQVSMESMRDETGRLLAASIVQENLTDGIKKIGAGIWNALTGMVKRVGDSLQRMEHSLDTMVILSASIQKKIDKIVDPKNEMKPTKETVGDVAWSEKLYVKDGDLADKTLHYVSQSVMYPGSYLHYVSENMIFGHVKAAKMLRKIDVKGDALREVMREYWNEDPTKSWRAESVKNEDGIKTFVFPELLGGVHYEVQRAENFKEMADMTFGQRAAVLEKNRVVFVQGETKRVELPILTDKALVQTYNLWNRSLGDAVRAAGNKGMFKRSLSELEKAVKELQKSEVGDNAEYIRMSRILLANTIDEMGQTLTKSIAYLLSTNSAMTQWLSASCAAHKKQ